MKNYVLGVDLGIGSIGWGLIDTEKGNEHIVDFGVRLFDSGELNGGKDRTSQERRAFRGIRRVLRRRSFRKDLLRQHIEYIQLSTKEDMARYFELEHNDVYALRTHALDEKLTANELCGVLLHICGHRGYNEFYEFDDAGLISEDAQKEMADDKMGVDAFKNLMNTNNYRTAGEMFYKDAAFEISRRNKDSKTERFLPTRSEIKNELSLILHKQAEFYPQLTTTNIERTMSIILSQRDFEDGPGNKNDVFRKYKGFLDSIGKCIFYGDARGFRGTVISDLYAVTNTLSQYTYINKDTGEIGLKREIAHELLHTLLQTGTLTKKEVKLICDRHNTRVNINEKSNENTLTKSIKYLRSVKKLIESSGHDWGTFASEEQLNLENPSKLHELGEVLSKFQTPKRKLTELLKLGWLDEAMAKNAISLKFSGTTNVCYSYMIDAINAFLNGEAYGNFQANKIKELHKESETEKHYKLPLLQDEYVTKNPVVFRAINETRKVINAIIDKYGSPNVINIEVASEVNQSYDQRRKEAKRMRDNENKNDAIKKEISELYNVDILDINPTMLDKFKLYKQQEGKCLYSDAILDEKRLFIDYEIDHIVPFSLILDNTLNNKALVLCSENQYKKQRTPLQYMSKEKADRFLAKVNEMFRTNKISDKKYQYLTLPNIYSPECQTLLDAWKSRNINDTRYITKYVTQYISNNLKFAGDTKVNGIKGAYTARFRRLWLNEASWGSKDRENSNLHHAIDAIVVANLTPAYIEIASDNIKLYQMFKSTGKIVTDDYKEYLEKAIVKMRKIYGFSEDYTRHLLTRKGRVPSAIPNLRDEVDIRFNDYDQELFDAHIQSFYSDEVFIKTLHMPLVSYKQNKKLQGTITDSNPLNIKEVDGELWELKREKVGDLTAKKLSKIHSEDQDLVDSLTVILNGKSEKYTVADYLKENNLDTFVTQKGTRVHKVTIKRSKIENPFYKVISENNKTALAANNYYCTEIYEDDKHNTCLRGIRRVDITKRNKKIFLSCEYPKNYAKHIMYLFKNEYIEVWDKKGDYKFKGFFKFATILGGYQQRIVGAKLNKPYKPAEDYFTLSKTDTIEKYHIDLLGRKGGKVKCGEPLSLLKEKK